MLTRNCKKILFSLECHFFRLNSLKMLKNDQNLYYWIFFSLSLTRWLPTTYISVMGYTGGRSPPVFSIFNLKSWYLAWDDENKYAFSCNRKYFEIWSFGRDFDLESQKNGQICQKFTFLRFWPYFGHNLTLSERKYK